MTFVGFQHFYVVIDTGLFSRQVALPLRRKTADVGLNRIKAHTFAIIPVANAIVSKVA